MEKTLNQIKYIENRIEYTAPGLWNNIKGDFEKLRSILTQEQLETSIKITKK